MRVSIESLRLGALYRLAVRKHLTRSQVEAVMVERLSFKEAAARALAGHWFTTEQLRAANGWAGRYDAQASAAAGKPMFSYVNEYGGTEIHDGKPLNGES